MTLKEFEEELQEELDALDNQRDKVAEELLNLEHKITQLKTLIGDRFRLDILDQ
jgi:peptidoglycan hydrolase CwlO-like protein